MRFGVRFKIWGIEAAVHDHLARPRLAQEEDLRVAYDRLRGASRWFTPFGICAPCIWSRWLGVVNAYVCGNPVIWRLYRGIAV